VLLVGTIGLMTLQEYLAALDADGNAFAEAAVGNLRAPVSSCPGWTVADLVYHLGVVHRSWTSIVAERRTEVEHIDLPARPDDDDLVAWYRDGLTDMRTTLAAADPATPIWTWAPQKDVAFVQRRMAQETAVHRWDAQLAAGVGGPIDPPLAVDGIDEYLRFMLGLGGGERGEPVGGSVHLHVTDEDLPENLVGEWMVHFDGDTPLVTTGHDKGDAALRGSASDLLLGLWRRLPMEALDVVGDRAVAARFLALTELA